MSKAASPKPYSPHKEPASFSVHASGTSMKELQRKLHGAFKFGGKGRRRGRR